MLRCFFSPFQIKIFRSSDSSAIDLNIELQQPVSVIERAQVH